MRCLPSKLLKGSPGRAPGCQWGRPPAGTGTRLEHPCQPYPWSYPRWLSWHFLSLVFLSREQGQIAPGKVTSCQWSPDGLWNVPLHTRLSLFHPSAALPAFRSSLLCVLTWSPKRSLCVGGSSGSPSPIRGTEHPTSPPPWGPPRAGFLQPLPRRWISSPHSTLAVPGMASHLLSSLSKCGDTNEGSSPVTPHSTVS